MRAGENGDFTDEGIRKQAARLLSSEKARRSVMSFFGQYLDLSRLNEVERDPAVYQGFTPTMPLSMRKELELVVDDIIFREDCDILTLFTTRKTFVNDELADLYELEVPQTSPISFVPVELPLDSKRQGILTLSAFLTMNAHQTETSPTLRGKYLRERILCQTVAAPPDDIDLNLDNPPGAEPRTLRERLEEHRENPACAGCHAFIDPPGSCLRFMTPWVAIVRTKANI